MKNILFTILVLSITWLNAQEKTTETKEPVVLKAKDGKANYEEVAFIVLENVPVYPGCDENMSNQALKECMSSQINTLIGKNFNTGLANTLNLPAGKTRIVVMFKIDTEGHVTDIRTRAPHPELEKEAIRVVKLIPKMDKAGYQDGEPVVVSYALPIVFMVEGLPPSKKEQRKLRRQKRKN